MRTLTKLLAVCLLFAASARADQIITDFRFDGGRGNIGPAEIFAVGPLVVVLAGYDRPFTLADMWRRTKARKKSVSASRRMCITRFPSASSCR